MSSDQEVRELVCELCRLFYEHGWVTGTGGSISIRWNDGIYMTPSGKKVRTTGKVCVKILMGRCAKGTYPS